MQRNANNSRKSAWCFTLNNPTAEEETSIKTWSTAEGIATYLVFGRERGENGTPHLQGYVEFRSRRTLSSVRGLSRRAHWESRRGTSEEAADYCKKDGDFFEEGVISRPGRRTDLETICEEIKAGVGEEQIAEQYFSRWVVYRRSFGAYRQLVMGRTRPRPRVEVLWGPTGTGKTGYVYYRHLGEPIWKWPGDQWFDGYDGHRVALFDDFNGEISLTKLLRVLDIYPEQVPVKGGFTWFVPEKIYITSNVAPAEWYPNASQAHIAALCRRFQRVEQVSDSVFD